METQVKKKQIMRGLIGPLSREPLTEAQRQWKQRSQESLAKILSKQYN